MSRWHQEVSLARRLGRPKPRQPQLADFVAANGGEDSNPEVIRATSHASSGAPNGNSAGDLQAPTDPTEQFEDIFGNVVPFHKLPRGPSPLFARLKDEIEPLWAGIREPDEDGGRPGAWVRHAGWGRRCATARAL